MKFVFKYLSRFILKLIGWKIDGGFDGLNKYVAVSAPHTSNMDFILGALYYSAVGEKASFLIKKELFFFPLGGILRYFGGVPVDRKNSRDIVKNMVNEYNTRDKFYLIITPEGTRQKSTNWKRGFYQIAREANVPVILSCFDYKNKIIKIFDHYYLGEDVNEEMRKIKLTFKDVTARFPENFSVGKIE